LTTNRLGVILGLFGIVAAASHPRAAAADQELYFAKAANVPLGETPMVFGPRDTIELVLTLRLPSGQERGRFSPLAIDGREPTVRIDVMEFRSGQPYLPASFRVERLRDVEVDHRYETARLWFLLGRSQPFYWIADHFGGIGKVSDKHWEGTYRITASYQNLTSRPIFVTIR
jgi:hypothetical protein